MCRKTARNLLGWERKRKREEIRSGQKEDRMFVGKDDVGALHWQGARRVRLNSGIIRAGGPRKRSQGVTGDLKGLRSPVKAEA